MQRFVFTFLSSESLRAVWAHLVLCPISRKKHGRKLNYAASCDVPHRQEQSGFLYDQILRRKTCFIKAALDLSPTLQAKAIKSDIPTLWHTWQADTKQWWWLILIVVRARGAQCSSHTPDTHTHCLMASVHLNCKSVIDPAANVRQNNCEFWKFRLVAKKRVLQKTLWSSVSFSPSFYQSSDRNPKSAFLHVYIFVSHLQPSISALIQYHRQEKLFESDLWWANATLDVLIWCSSAAHCALGPILIYEKDVKR